MERQAETNQKPETGIKQKAGLISGFFISQPYFPPFRPFSATLALPLAKRIKTIVPEP